MTNKMGIGVIELRGLVCIIEHSDHRCLIHCCSGTMHGMGHADPCVLLYRLTS